MDTMPMVVDSRVLVPARFVAESFNLDVSWDADSKQVAISDKGSEQTTLKAETTTAKAVTEATTEATTVKTVVIKAEKTTEKTTAEATTEETTQPQDRNIISGVSSDLHSLISEDLNYIISEYSLGKITISDRLVESYKTKWSEKAVTSGDTEYMNTAVKLMQKLNQIYVRISDYTLWSKTNTVKQLCTDYANDAHSQVTAFINASTIDAANDAYAEVVNIYNDLTNVMNKDIRPF
jgi:hypothetical protein